MRAWRSSLWTVYPVAILRGLCTVLIAAASVLLPTPAGGSANKAVAGPASASDGGDQSVSVTVPRLVFGAPPWLALRLYVVEYIAGTELSTIGASDCSVTEDLLDEGCLMRRPNGNVWFVVLAS